MGTPSSTQPDTIERARYKLRQAELALGYLRQVPAEIALDQRRARPLSIPDIRLDTFQERLQHHQEWSGRSLQGRHR